MKEIFTKEESNFGRQRELDIAKGIAVFFMIWVHVNEVYQSTAIEGGVYNRIIEFIGSPPAAPIFMMMLGTGIIYSKKSTAGILLKRGIFLVCLGYILNFFRDYIPYFLLTMLNNDPEYIIEGWELLWGTDILHFAGLSFMFFSFIKKFKIKTIGIFMIWCGFVTLNILLKGVSFDNPIINGFFRLIWGTDENAWFPFLTWITFPVMGYFFGQLLIRCNDKNTLYKNILLISGSFSIPLWIYSYFNDIRFGAFGELYQTEYYHHDIIGNIVLCTFALFWISICYFISKCIPEILEKIMVRWSRNINSMYCVHWIIIGYLMLVLEEVAYMPLEIFIIMIVVCITTDIICTIFTKRKLARYSLKANDKIIIS